MTDLDSHMRDVVSRTRASFRAGKVHSYEQRLQFIEGVDSFLVQEEDAIFDALQADLGKCRAEAVLSELGVCRSEVAHIQKNLRSWMARKPVSKTFVFHFTRDVAAVQAEPFGVVTLLCPWNYPVYLTLMPLLGAIAAGNCAIIKPSEVSVHVAELFKTRLPKYLPQDCFPVVCGGVLETTALLRQRVDYIFYTGSTAVGRIVMRAAAEHITPVTLELGGKCPTFIDESSDIAVVANRVVANKCLNAGQTCISLDYILCTRKTQDLFIAAAKNSLKTFFGEDMQKAGDFGRIINDRHFQRLAGVLDKSRAHLAIDMGTDRADRFMGLKVLSDVSETDAVMEDEIFGPILPIVPVADVDEAIDFIRSREKPLAAYVFSRDDSVTEKFIEFTSSGAILANDAMVNMSLSSLPFGGVGHSGIGSYHGKFSFDTFSHKKAVMLRGQSLEFLNTQLRYPPFKDSSVNMLRHTLFSTPGEGLLLYIKTLVIATLAFLGLATASLKSRR